MEKYSQLDGNCLHMHKKSIKCRDAYLSLDVEHVFLSPANRHLESIEMTIKIGKSSISFTLFVADMHNQ